MKLHMRVAAATFCLCAAALLASFSPPAAAAVDGLQVELTGGTVTGPVRGQGKAVVEARVTNTGSRSVNGVRIGVFYAAADLLPGDGADWRVHEFVFEPPLAPGKSTTLRFSDENAAEYILIELQRASYGLGLTYNGLEAGLNQPLMEMDGVVYIATRDLMQLIGGGISYDAQSYMIVLERSGLTLKLKAGQDYALLNGERTPLRHPVLEIESRSLLPLEEVARLLELSCNWSADGSTLELRD